MDTQKVSLILTQKDPLVIEGLFKRLLFGCPGLALFLGFNRGLYGAGHGRALFKLVHVAGRVQQLLLAGIKRVAVAANFRVEFFHGGAGGKLIAAGAGDNRCGIKLGMDGGFHKIYSFRSPNIWSLLASKTLLSAADKTLIESAMRLASSKSVVSTIMLASLFTINNRSLSDHSGETFISCLLGSVILVNLILIPYILASLAKKVKACYNGSNY